MLQLEKYLESMRIRVECFDSVLASGGEKVPKYSLALNYTPKNSVAFCFPSRSYGIYQAFGYNNGSAVFISIFEPLFLVGYFTEKLDVPKYIWRATDNNRLADALEFIKAPNNPPSVLFISLSNLFFNTPTPGSTPISSAQQAELYERCGFRFVHLAAPPKQKKVGGGTTKIGPQTISYEPGQVRSSFTHDDRNTVLEDVFRLFGVSLGPKFPPINEISHQADLNAKMNCFKDPRNWFLTRPQKSVTLQDHCNIVVNVDYFGPDRKSYQSVYNDDIDKYTGFGPKRNERMIACPGRLLKIWQDEFKENSTFFGLVSKLIRPIYATLALPPHAIKLDWKPSPQGVAWKDAAKILYIYNWMSVLAKDMALKPLISQRLCTDYNESMINETMLLKLVQYKHGADQISFVDSHLQEARPLLDTFIDKLCGLVAWPFLLAKLWPGVEARLTLQSFVQRILGCQTLRVEVLPISELTGSTGLTGPDESARQDDIESYMWWLDSELPRDQMPTKFNIQSHLLFPGKTEPGSLFVKCFDMNGQEMAFNLGKFVRTHSVYCTSPTTKAAEYSTRLASQSPWKLDCVRTMSGHANLQLQSEEPVHTEVFKKIYSHKLLENVIANILYQCGGLRLSKNETTTLDNSMCSVACISSEPPQPNYIFTDDSTPRSVEIDCNVKSSKTHNKLDTANIGMQFNVEYNCVYDFILSQPATVDIYIVPKKNLSAPISLGLEGIESTYRINTGPSNSFALFCDQDKTIILDFISQSHTLGTINVRRYIRPFTSIIKNNETDF